MKTKPCAICHTDIPTRYKYCDPCRTKVRRERKMDWQNLYRKSHSKEYREYHRKWKASSKGYSIGLGAQLVMSRLGITADTMREHYAKLTAEPEKVTDFISI